MHNTGIDVVVVNDSTDADERISATRIRHAIAAGQIGVGACWVDTIA